AHRHALAPAQLVGQVERVALETATAAEAVTGDADAHGRRAALRRRRPSPDGARPSYMISSLIGFTAPGSHVRERGESRHSAAGPPHSTESRGVPPPASMTDPGKVPLTQPAALP